MFRIFSLRAGRYTTISTHCPGQRADAGRHR